MHQITDIKKDFSKIKNNTTDSRQLIKCSSEHNLGNFQMNTLSLVKIFCHPCILVLTKNISYFHSISENVLRLKHSCHLCIPVLAKNKNYFPSVRKGPGCPEEKYYPSHIFPSKLSGLVWQREKFKRRRSKIRRGRAIWDGACKKVFQKYKNLLKTLRYLIQHQ